jgi:hypothetical protein
LESSFKVIPAAMKSVMSLNRVEAHCFQVRTGTHPNGTLINAIA